MSRTLAILVSIICCATLARAQADGLVVHEWGTFTSLQDGTGRAIGAINQDVEPLPDFVHNLIPGENAPKGIPTHQDVTMRLETPVVYFHLPKATQTMEVDFSAEFRGGWLTQFYPKAAHNFTAGLVMPKIDSSTVGTLTWKGLQIGTTARGPSTSAHVWLAPRKVDAANVTATSGESERYLFYRGVGHLDAPLKVIRAGEHLRITGDRAIDQLWYLDARPNGALAFRKLDPGNQDKPGIVTPAEFAAADYRADNLAVLRKDMKAALISSGLFEDEALAMLNTWEDSYFLTPGARLLFLVPRTWVDEKLPIKVSVAARIERAMVGRIDLVTPKQRQIAQAYLALPNKNEPQATEMINQLGRFANAILADERLRQSSPAPTASIAR